MRTKPVTIIGGGLAGLGLANGLRLANIPVTVHEAGSYPRHRVCGEFMAGLNYDLVAKLGLKPCFEGALLHRSVAWIRQGRPVRTFQLPEPALGISRYALDERMARLLVERGGQLKENSAQPDAAKARAVNACGRVPVRNGYCGFKGHWRGMETSADLELHLGRNGYIGISRVEDDFMNVCGLFRRVAPGDYPSPLKRFHATLEQHGLGYLVDRLHARDLRPRSMRSVIGLSYPIINFNRTASLGDQHGLIPPFTGNGMTIALESAALLCPLVIDFSYGTKSWEELQARGSQLLRQHFRKRTLTAGLLHPFILNSMLQHLVSVPSRLNLLPFRFLYKLTHS